MIEKNVDEMTDAEWLRYGVEIDSYECLKDAPQRLLAIATRLELLEKVEAERRRSASKATEAAEAAAELMVDLVDYTATEMNSDKDDIDLLPEYIIALAIYHLANEVKAAGRTTSMGATLGGVAQAFGQAIGAGGLKGMMGGLIKKDAAKPEEKP